MHTETKSPLLLRSNPIMNPMPNGRLMRENDSARGKHLFLFYYFAKQTKQDPSMNSCQNLSSVNLSNCQGGIFLRSPKLSDKKPVGNRQAF